MYYSPSTKGFYSFQIHGDKIPSDAVEISIEEYENLLLAQSHGQLIIFDEESEKPVAVNQPESFQKYKFSPLEFLEKFTEAEQLSVVAATRVSDPIKLWYDKMLASTFVDLNDPRTSAGLTALVAEGLIPQSRYDEIMGVAE